MFNTAAGWLLLIPIEQLYPPLFTLSGARQLNLSVPLDIRKVNPQHLESKQRMLILSEKQKKTSTDVLRSARTNSPHLIISIITITIIGQLTTSQTRLCKKQVFIAGHF